ncbi:winged helix-turn-helix domain-containing protein [Granulicella tundricola]|uniref:Transcriptional regulator, CadC n=1 Tax=Granulicella tundricola (strain ATCC BAA-1859 / DSM 23138 / MP5ACTX9) TaxID=1198114 RepID=E8WVB4_GRATM|nr:winged helix-turn-helix domain-containing protein [Granulicella tundricola]ADW67289.1 transcriptional regulator, CadC [Granulicella tundricola MP5ACTX9]
MRIKLQGQPFEVLRVLLERHNEIVSKEELQARLWQDGTTVDFDHSLGTAVNKIRQALGDSAENPRFVQTIARRGYRFIAPLRFLEEAPAELPAEEAVPLSAVIQSAPSRGHAAATNRIVSLSESVVPAPEARLAPARPHLVPPIPVALEDPYPDEPSRRHHLAPILITEAAVLILVAFLAFTWWRSAQHPTPFAIHQITFSGMISPGEPEMEALPSLATDGPRLIAPIITEGASRLSQVSISEGQTTSLDLPPDIAGPAIGDISPDGTRLLVRNHLEGAPEQALWIVPTLGHEARRIPNLLAHDATWMPDGRHILFANGSSLFLAADDGSNVRKFADLSGRAFWLRWSPDGKLLRFTLLDPATHNTALWQIASDGTHPQAVFPANTAPTNECCGSWTSDSRYFVFQSTRGAASANATQNIWAVDNQHRWLDSNPFQVTNGPLSYQGPATARTGHTIFFLGLNARMSLLRFDLATHQFKPLRQDSSMMGHTQVSYDGRWIAWINQSDGSLWRSRADGSERLQLTSAPTEVFRMHWSADDLQLAIMARQPGTPWKISVLSNAGGSSQPLLDERRDQADPSFSPDGRQVVFGRPPDLMGVERDPKSIAIVDLATHRVDPLPGSAGLFSPSWSPDGHYISAFPLDQSGIRLFDTRTHTWRNLITRSAADPAWSHDGKWIFFHAFAEPGSPIYRVNVDSGELIRITGLSDLANTDVVDFYFSGLTQDDAPIITARMSTANAYSLNLDAR